MPIHQDVQVFFHRVALKEEFFSPSVYISEIVLSQVQHSALGLVERPQVHMDLLSNVPLGGIPPFCPINCTTQLGIITKFAEGALSPTVSVPLSIMLKSTAPKTEPWRTPLITGLNLDIEPLTISLLL